MLLLSTDATITRPRPTTRTLTHPYCPSTRTPTAPLHGPSVPLHSSKTHHSFKTHPTAPPFLPRLSSPCPSHRVFNDEFELMDIAAAGGGGGPGAGGSGGRGATRQPPLRLAPLELQGEDCLCPLRRVLRLVPTVCSSFALFPRSVRQAEDSALFPQSVCQAEGPVCESGSEGVACRLLWLAV